ncbi:MAG: HD domain-containing phosphohydrolase, partial [Thermoanaerobaculales bacterium]
DYVMKDRVARLGPAVERELREAEERRGRRRAEEAYRTLVQSSLQGFLIMQDGKIVFANTAIAEILGYTVEELLALTPEQVEASVHQEDRALVWGRYRDRLAGKEAPPRYEMRMIRSDGKTCWAEIMASRVEFDGRPAIQAALADVTTRVRKEMEQRAIATVATSLRAAEDRSEMVSTILDQVESLLNAEGVALAMHDEISGDVVFESARGAWTAMIGRRMSCTEGLTGQVFETGATYVSNDVLKTEKVLWPSILEKTPAVAGVPLIAGKVTIGVLWMGRSGSISEDDTIVLTAIGEMIASALRRLTLNEALRRSHRELTDAYDGTLEGWARALELRDTDTEGHTRRVADMTVQLGRALGCGHQETIQLRRGALLHDIGKMAIPDRVLNKPGPLNDDEWQIMRRHPEHAFDMLSRVAYLRPALDIPYGHHEKWDGSGYPRGLAGEDIPLAARIFAVVDVWDAVRSDRPYRKAWPHEKAVRYLRDQAGRHFDPRVAGVFLDSVLGREEADPDREAVTNEAW